MGAETVMHAFQSHPASTVIAVGSGKGGVGKSTVSVNLALGLQALGGQVGLFDADIYGPNVPLLLGIHRRRPAKQWEGKSWAPVWRPQAAPQYIRPLERFGLRIMSLGLLVAEDQPINPLPEEVGRLAVQTLRDIQWGALDYLVIDMPPGWGMLHEAVVSAVRLDGVLVVTTPQDLALLDSARSLKLYQRSEAPLLGIVENMSYFECPACGERHEIFARNPARWTELLGDLPLLQRIPLMPTVSQRLTQAYLDSFHGEAAHGPGALFVQLARQVVAAVHDQTPFDR
jgi:ATP-binding protein involved in chromosome partitioning